MGATSDLERVLSNIPDGAEVFFSRQEEDIAATDIGPEREFVIVVVFRRVWALIEIVKSELLVYLSAYQGLTRREPAGRDRKICSSDPRTIRGYQPDRCTRRRGSRSAIALRADRSKWRFGAWT